MFFFHVLQLIGEKPLKILPLWG